MTPIFAEGFAGKAVVLKAGAEWEILVVNDLNERFKKALDIKSNFENGANGAKAAGAAYQARGKDCYQDSVNILGGLLSKVTADTKSLSSSVFAANEMRKGPGTDWRTFSTWLANIASDWLLLMFNENIKLMSRGMDEKTLNLTFIKSIRNRADAKKWAKSLTNELARTQVMLRTAKKTYESRLQEHRRDLKTLAYTLKRFRKQEASMARNYRLFLEIVDFSLVADSHRKIAREVARQVFWSNITTHRYKAYGYNVGHRRRGK